jgi:hypothetical protein
MRSLLRAVQCTESLQTSSLHDRRRPSKVSIREKREGLLGADTKHPFYRGLLGVLITKLLT